MMIDVSPDAPTTLAVDDLTVFRAALNVLTTACARTATGFVRLHIYSEQEDHQQQLYFSCTAPAVQPQDRSCVLDSLRNDLLEPELIGLRYAAALITTVQGRCGFEDDTFWFSVPNPTTTAEEKEKPAAPAQQQRFSSSLSPKTSLLRVPSVPVKQQPVVAASPSKRRKHALVVEDSLVVRKTLGRSLSMLGFQVAMAENGMEGMERMKERPYDLVVCDFLMPVMDGMDCVKQYRGWEKTNRPGFSQYILGVSAHASRLDSQKGLEAGMDRFQPKPLSRDTLKEIMDSDEVQERSRQLDALAYQEPAGELQDDNMTSTISLDDSERVSAVSEAPISPSFVTDDNTQSSWPSSPRSSSSSMECSRKRKHGPEDDELTSSSSSSDENRMTLRHCLVASPTNHDAMHRMLEDKGWVVETVHSSDKALELLQRRNWDAVIMDGEAGLSPLSSFLCIQEFREWERHNRVNRQNNVYLRCPRDCPSTSATYVHPPRGVDGVLPPAPSWDDFWSLWVEADGANSDKMENNNSSNKNMYVITR